MTFSRRDPVASSTPLRVEGYKPLRLTDDLLAAHKATGGTMECQRCHATIPLEPGATPAHVRCPTCAPPS